MNDTSVPFPPRVAESHARLRRFAPMAGAPYARMRNFDLGAGAHTHVSCLSPYLRMKVLDEGDVSRAVLAAMPAKEADKFIAEVWWRTYWKGWMEQRPSIWAQYCDDLTRLHNQVQSADGLRARWEAACLGQTGVAPFDAWAQELAQTGYLHNHARMWFASIWIFTLELPWQLGADFFLRHLLDGDAAVNTLSWRWVAGLQTIGKTYLADPDNIAKFTQGRFADVAGLARHAPAREAPPPPERMAIPHLPSAPEATDGRVGLLLHSDDIGAEFATKLGVAPVQIAYLDRTAAQSCWATAPRVTEFRAALARDAHPTAVMLQDAAGLVDWARAHGLDRIITPHAPVGTLRCTLHTARRNNAPPIHEFRRAIDSAAWPHATAGFFKFRKHIPALLERFAGTA